MAQVIVQVGANGDDGIDNGSTFNAAANTQWQGDLAGANWSNFARFTLTGVQQGATVASAYLRQRCDTSSSGTTFRCNIEAVAADDPAAPTSHAEFAALGLTGSPVTWDGEGSWTLDSWYDSPNIGSLVQAVVNRPGWAAGQHIIIVVVEDGSDANAYRRAYAYNISAANAPKLEVNYTNPGGIAPIQHSYRQRRV